MHVSIERGMHTLPGYFCCKDETSAAESERKSHLVGFRLGSHVSLSLCVATSTMLVYHSGSLHERSKTSTQMTQSASLDVTG